MARREVRFTHFFRNDKTDSVVREAYYDNANLQLFVVLSNGIIAGYKQVVWSEWVGFENASSKGIYWNHFIKPNYDGIDGDVTFRYAKQVEPEPEDDLPEPDKTFRVVLTVSGDLAFNVQAEDLQSAVDKASGLVHNSLVDGTVYAKEVKLSDQ